MPNVNKIKRKIKRNRFKLILLLLIIGSILIIYNQIQNEAQKTPTPTNSPTPMVSPSTATQTPSADIEKNLSNELSKISGDYFVYIKDLKTNQIYVNKADTSIPSASIYKLTVMYKTFDEINRGTLQENQLLKGDITVSEALRKMITFSDNESALLLAEKIGWANINNYIKDQGITGFNLLLKDYPTTTAKATGDLLEKIYNNTAVSPTYSKKMMGLLLAQEINDRIPSFLPKEINVAHKTGELDNFRHDAGIVFGKKSDYIFVFLTETPRPEDSYENIANLSKKMFELLETP